jgi:hypothetical protein
MTNTLPTDATFLICEDVREEKGGKVSLLGVFAGGDVQLANFKDGMGIDLCVYCMFRGGAGAFNMQATLIDPKGAVAKGPVESAVVEEGNTLGFTIRMRPLMISSLGIYRLVVTIDGKDFEFNFPILENQSIA